MKGNHMFKQLSLPAILTVAVLTPYSLLAQANTNANPAPRLEQHYHLDFVVKEVEAGKVINSRSYSMVIATNGHAEIRNGTRVPFNMSSVTDGGKYTTSQYTQVDVGVNIDCNSAKELNNQLTLEVKAEISSLADPNDGGHPGGPVVRHNTWESNVIIPIRQPTTIFSSDDLASKRKMRLEITATPIK
jgi:hypothetical protein